MGLHGTPRPHYRWRGADAVNSPGSGLRRGRVTRSGQRRASPTLYNGWTCRCGEQCHCTAARRFVHAWRTFMRAAPTLSSHRMILCRADARHEILAVDMAGRAASSGEPPASRWLFECRNLDAEIASRAGHRSVFRHPGRTAEKAQLPGLPFLSGVSPCLSFTPHHPEKAAVAYQAG
jgi:hypothetical protein